MVNGREPSVFRDGEEQLLPIEATIVGALEAGSAPTLADLGGPGAIRGYEAQLAAGPYAVPLLDAILEALEDHPELDDRAFLERTVAFLAGAPSLEGHLVHDVVPRIALARGISVGGREACFRAFVGRINDATQEPIARWSAMDGALRLALDDGAAPRRHRLLANLYDIAPNDDGFFLRHAAKIIGVAYSHWRDDGLVARLTDLATVEEAEDEAAFEIGMACVASGLDASDHAVAASRFTEARGWFERSLVAGDNRPDAGIYAAALDLLAGFGRGVAAGETRAAADHIQDLALRHRAFHEDDDDPPWLGARWTEMCGWGILALHLRDVAADLDGGGLAAPERIASLVRERILVAFVAGRSLLRRDRTGGIEAVVRPRIAAALGPHETASSGLDRWLAAGMDGPSGAAEELRAAIQAALSGEPPGKPEGTPGPLP